MTASRPPRAMTDGLRAVLDALNEPERRVVLHVASEGGTSLVARLMQGIATELLAQQVNDAAVIAALEADRQSELRDLEAMLGLPDSPQPQPDLRFDTE
jgi:hypothetical protein